MKTKFCIAVALVALASASSGAANATASSNHLYDNLNESTQGAHPYSDFVLGPLAASFSTGDMATTLGTVSVSLQAQYSDPPGDYATVLLLADNNTTPGAVIATLGTVGDGDLSSAPTIYSFSGGEQLSADTRYWIQITGTDTSIGAWNFEGDASGVGVAGEYFSNFNGVSANSNGAYQMDVTAEAATISAAPEPSTWLLMMAGIGGAGLWLRRAKASSSALAAVG